MELYFRYAGQSENTEINEKCADLALDIEFAEERKEKADVKIDVVGSIEKKVKLTLHKQGLYLNYFLKSII